MTETAGQELTSLRSPRVKAARQLAKRALRERARSFLAEGPQSVREALAHGGIVTQLFLTAAARTRYPELAGQASQQGAGVHTVSGEVMADLAQTITPQGVLAVCRFVDVPLVTLTGAAPHLAVILANVRDPGNAGTVLRTADAAPVSTGSGTSTNRQTARTPCGVTVCASSAMTSPLTTCTAAPWRLARAASPPWRDRAAAVRNNSVTTPSRASASPAAWGPSARNDLARSRKARLPSWRAALTLGERMLVSSGPENSAIRRTHGGAQAVLTRRRRQPAPAARPSPP